MRIFISTLGSRGDVQPYIALGKALQSHGHHVTVSTCCYFESFIREHGLDYGYVNNAFMELIQSDQGHDLIAKSRNPIAIAKATWQMRKSVEQLQWDAINDTWQAVQEAKPDLMVYHPKAFIAQHIAEKLNIPAVMSFLMPLFIPTSQAPCMGFPRLPLGKAYNQFTHKLVLQLLKFGTRKYVKTWRTENGLAPLGRKIDAMHHADGSPIPFLLGYSPLISPRPTDWPAHVHVTGYWHLDQLEQYKPPQNLVDFLEQGSPPVYVGFGSMADKNPKRLTGIVIEAIKRANVRGIIATGWGGLHTDNLPPAILKIDEASHDWLFPKCSAVAHHGGAGSTAASLRAGKPTIICPFSFDQPYWGKRIHELGLGPKPLPQRKLTAQQLAKAIKQATTDQTIMQNAHAIGDKLRKENGVMKAVEIIEQLGSKSIKA